VTTSDIVLDRLMTLHPKLIDLSLDRTQRLLRSLGEPQRHLPATVHVAGTNGKGSVIAYLRAMLEAAGRRVHVYTSPHLVRFNERIRLSGELISEPDLLELLEECEAANGGQPITFFEITTCAAFLAFARRPADVLLLEVGLGGEFDATNVIEHPCLTVLMPISFDHMLHLGHTLTAIAGAKAGIMKPRVPAVVAPQPPEAAAVFERRAQELSCPLHRHGRDWRVASDGHALSFSDDAGVLRLPLPALPGPHQVENAGAAIACLKYLHAFNVERAHIERGLANVEWPARLQRLRRGPLVEMLPSGWELWLDGAHNAAGGEALASMATIWRASSPSLPLHLIFGSLSTHDPLGVLQPLIPFARDIHAVAVPGEHKTLSAEDSSAAARRAGAKAMAADSVAAALADTVATAHGPARVLICGSLYLAGTVLAENG
jgi:dihydrofolate synthase/folylpolyglutamate synthase